MFVKMLSFLIILSNKIEEDSDSKMSQEFMVVVMIINVNFVIVSIIFLNTICQKGRLIAVATSTFILYAIVMIHEFGLDGINSEITESGFDS